MNHPPGLPQHSAQPSRLNPQDQPGWFDRHPVWAGILCVLAAIITFAAATLAWILGEEKFGFMIGFLTVVFLCYVVAGWRKTFRMRQRAKS